MLSRESVLEETAKEALMEQEILKKALLAYQLDKLEKGIVQNGFIRKISSQPEEAENQIRVLLKQGYTLKQNENGYYFSRGLEGGSSIKEFEKKLDLKPKEKPSVFISYESTQRSIALNIQKSFEAQGYLIFVREADTFDNDQYLTDIAKVIMHSNLDYILPIVSKNYFFSKICMYEMTQVIRRDQWENILLPYLVDINTEYKDVVIENEIQRYKSHWQKYDEKKEKESEREICSSIIRNITLFCETIFNQANISEKDIINKINLVDEMMSVTAAGKLQILMTFSKKSDEYKLMALR